MKRIILLTVALFAFLVQNVLLAQPFSVDVLVRNQPQGTILFGSVKGDDFIRIDSIRTSESISRVKFNFPENAHSGVYRIIFGNTGYERIMNKPPHQLDLIFDNENIEIETDFNSPEDDLKIKQSKENIAWYSFRKKDRELMEKISQLEAEVDKTGKTQDTLKFQEVVNQYNQFQMERDMFVVQASQDCRGLFVSQIIKNQRLPVLDGFLSGDERIKTFKTDFFRVLDFSNPDLINSQVYTDNVFNYLIRYNSPILTQKQREAEYQKAVDVIMPAVKQNAEVYKFVKNYLLHGFEVLKMNTLITYINKKYP